MCGIVAYIGKREASSILMEGLSRMEYRGYDSAGIVVVEEGKAQYHKAKGRVAALVEKIENKKLISHTGIAHTRWATHGAPSDANAHPHVDCKSEFFVVHNGIIENYGKIKESLIKEGHKFKSETDTEVLPHLIEKYYKGNLAEAVRSALKKVTGAYGIAVVSTKEPDTFIAAKFGSPLVLGLGSDEYIVASDVTAILPVTQKVVYFDDGEMVIVKKDGYEITDLNKRHKEKATEQIEWNMEAAEKAGFPHFMLKEIFEQPEAIKNSIRGRLIVSEGDVKLGGLQDVQEKLRGIDRLIVLAMGSAKIAGMVGKYMIEEYAGLPVEVEFASEFSYKKTPFQKKTAVLFVSQSGESADTLIAVKEATKKGLLTLGIVNVIGSSISRETKAGVYNHIGPEIAVAATKSQLSQMTIFALLSIYLGRQRDMTIGTGQRIIKEIKNLPSSIDAILDTADAIKKIAKKFKDAEHYYFLGRKYNYPIALEGALKLKEISYIHAEGFNSAEMKHGPIALIDKTAPIVVIAPTDSVYEKNVGHIKELKARGGKVIAIATQGNEEIAEIADHVIYIPKTLEMLTPILAAVPLQLLAYYTAVARGTDVDKPRNLAKSVTVE
jgi:glutamine---fructose-6-phosphate transaminase (isomerizing)